MSCTPYPLTAVGRTAIAIWRDAPLGNYGNSGIPGQALTQENPVTGEVADGVRSGLISAGDATGNPPANWSPSASRWLLIERVGDEFISSRKYFLEAEWVEFNRHTSAMEDPILVGIAGMTDTNGMEPEQYNVQHLRNFGPGIATGPFKVSLDVEIQSGSVIVSWPTVPSENGTATLLFATTADGEYTPWSGDATEAEGTSTVVITPGELTDETYFLLSVE